MSSNTHGNENEKSISTALNKKIFKDVENLNLKTFIKDICPSVTEDSFILCSALAGIKKQDVQIIIGKNSYNISVKVGSGNSVHQEKLEPFIKLLKSEYKINEALADDIRFFIWGDGSLDGKAPQSNRMKSTEKKSKYPLIINHIQEFFDNNRYELLKRFLVTGANGGEIDFIYYGTTNDGVWCSAEKAIQFQMSVSKGHTSSIGLGNMTFQTWNPCIKSNAKEKYRDTLQIKWGSIQKDIVVIRDSCTFAQVGTHEGNSSEFNLSRILNRNKIISNRNWKIIINNLGLSDHLDEIYAVKVSKKVTSKLIGKKVLPKTDVYLIKAKIDHRILLLNNYQLDENLTNKIDHEVIIGSGISVKRPGSSNFTVQKLSISSFKALFGNTHLAAGASLYCNAKELYKNNAVVEGWGSSYEEICSEDLGIYDYNILSSPLSTIEEKMNLCKSIKTNCNKNIREIILNNQEISDLIFKGERNFEEPYVAHFIYKNQIMQLNMPTDISITTGSGRSKGKYTIEIKPR